MKSMLHLDHSPFDGTQLCATVDPEIFFPENYVDKEPIEIAKAICNDCWLKNQCLEFSMHESDGIWGGTTPMERKRLRRKVRALARSQR